MVTTDCQGRAREVRMIEAGTAVDDLTQTSDAHLVRLARAGSDDASAELWYRHSAAGRRAAAQITRRYDADDLVQEAFARILAAIARGAGPDGAFRPYLYATIRNVAATWGRAHVERDSIDAVAQVADPDSVFDAAVLDRSIAARAFSSLRPEVREILWYTEVEGMSSGDAGRYLGLGPGAAATMASRARDRLRTAWVQAHVSGADVDPGCRWTVERLGAHARRTLARRDHRTLERHLRACERCAVLADELDDVAGRLRAVLVPLVCGPVAAGFLAAPGAGGPAASPAGAGVGVGAAGGGPAVGSGPAAGTGSAGGTGSAAGTGFAAGTGSATASGSAAVSAGAGAGSGAAAASAAAASTVSAGWTVAAATVAAVLGVAGVAAAVTDWQEKDAPAATSAASGHPAGSTPANRTAEPASMPDSAPGPEPGAEPPAPAPVPTPRPAAPGGPTTAALVSEGSVLSVAPLAPEPDAAEDPAPTEQVSAEPVPVEPAPAAPVPAEPVPEPSRVDPAPAEPTPADPAPAEPGPTAPDADPGAQGPGDPAPADPRATSRPPATSPRPTRRPRTRPPPRSPRPRSRADPAVRDRPTSHRWPPWCSILSSRAPTSRASRAPQSQARSSSSPPRTGSRSPRRPPPPTGRGG
ncbi:sigma-70 family RNA polymerase sigma factor [Xylanimonas protaetiae]|uniref:Sigma-70 family RNA polymerase sigma factor n=1 Tax=Xylanimonas protaetiae TaxID=2509457 RepID=A0A4V0YG77_9MICO|nr:sigma-70 family RNA polymerase sigma factor [Xylanimonas protaetiae]